MNIYIFPNLDKLNCKEYAIKACTILHSESANVFMDKCYIDEFNLDYIEFSSEIECVKKCDFVIAIGGDGTILKCAEIAAVNNKPILGINCGRLGFMASLEHTELDRLKDLCAGKYSLSNRMMLKAEIFEYDNNYTFYALNDIVVSKCDNCKIIDFEVSKNGYVISSLRADGVVFSTATGATAYSMSAGGPIIEPDMDCIEFTQICPHSLFARSMILSPETILDIKCNCNNYSHSVVSVDGNIMHKISNNSRVRISKADIKLSIIDIAGGSFFNSVNNKLMQPLKEFAEEQ